MVSIQHADAAKAREEKAAADTAEKVKALKEAEAQVSFVATTLLCHTYFNLADKAIGLP